MKQIKFLLGLSTFLFLSFRPANPDEGMYLLSQIQQINLNKAGLKIPVQDIYNPEGTGLIDALVRLDGCTGSFVSDQGLIITNHHCAFGAAAAISTAENNYIENGFYAASAEKEVKTSMTCKIAQSYADVSNRVLMGVKDNMNFESRNELIQSNSDKILKEETALYPGLKIEISQMSVGKIYTLFRYKVLNDIRLVYVPPRSVGEFGGESDNWVWPRHNADFSFVRAYENGVPYKPKKFLKINTKGVNENDFVFILGYPGRTFRHQPYKFLEYQRDKVLPFVADWYEFKIKSMHDWAGSDDARKIVVASYIKSLANTSKNFRGKIQGLKRTSVVNDKRMENEKLKEFVRSSDVLQAMYGGVIGQIDSLYSVNIRYAERDMLVNELFQSVSTLFAAHFINARKAEIANIKDKSGLKQTLEANKEAYRKSLQSSYRIYDPEMDASYLNRLLFQISQLPENVRPEFMKQIKGKGSVQQNIERFTRELYKKSKLKNKDATWKLFDEDLVKFFMQREPMMAFAASVYAESSVFQKDLAGRNGLISTLMPKFTEIKMRYYDQTFIPDANATLRLTYGYVKGYTPEDAVYNKPFTYIRGILEKAQTSGDYYLPENIRSVYQSVQPSDNLTSGQSAEIPVAMLYNLDTTGGNSGSPVLDAEGNLIGVNFDRAFTATINDYAWNEEYSRSIGVDIRYVLFVMKKIGKTDRLLTELNVPD